jgi:hypothetical protein
LRTENLEIPRCAIAHLRFSPDGLPRNDGGYDAVRLGSLRVLPRGFLREHSPGCLTPINAERRRSAKTWKLVWHCNATVLAALANGMGRIRVLT